MDLQLAGWARLESPVTHYVRLESGHLLQISENWERNQWIAEISDRLVEEETPASPNQYPAKMLAGWMVHWARTHPECDPRKIEEAEEGYEELLR